MTCPVCGEKTTVVSSRGDVDVIYRKRKCCACGHIFYTEEYETRTAEKDYKELEQEYQQNWRMNHD